MAQLDSSVFDSVPIDPRGNAQPFSPRLTIEKRGVSRLTFSIDNNHRSIEFLSASFPNTALLPWEDYDRRGRVQNECGISYTCAPKSPIRPMYFEAVHPGKEFLDDGRDTIHRWIDICIYIWDDGSRRLKQRKRERVPDVDLRLLTVKKQSKYIYIPGKGLLRSCDRRGSWPANIDLLRPRFLPIAVPFLILL